MGTMTVRALRRGFTIVELSVAASLVLLVLAMVHALWSGASRSTGRTAEHSDALRSVLLAGEVIRSDVAQMLYQKPSRDLQIMKSGTSIGLRVPGVLDASDMWSPQKNTYWPVVHSLDPVPGGRNVFRLMRESASGTRPVADCLLGGLHFELVAPGVLSSMQGYLQVTMVGVGSPRPAALVTSSLLIPVTPMWPPVPYRIANGRRQP